MSSINGYMPGWPTYTMYFCDRCKKDIGHDTPLRVDGKDYCSACLKKLVKSGELQRREVVTKEEFWEEWGVIDSEDHWAFHDPYDEKMKAQFMEDLESVIANADCAFCTEKRHARLCAEDDEIDAELEAEYDRHRQARKRVRE